MSKEELLKALDVAAILGVSVRTLKDWRRKKQGPKWLALGRNIVRYRESEVWEFLKNRGNVHGAN